MKELIDLFEQTKEELEKEIKEVATNLQSEPFDITRPHFILYKNGELNMLNKVLSHLYDIELSKIDNK